MADQQEFAELHAKHWPEVTVISTLRQISDGPGGARRLTGAHYAGRVPAETSTDDPTEAIIAAWRAESARLVGALTRMTRDVELAEDLAQDALVAALEQWPAAGVPDNPGAWLMTTAKRRGVDHFRRADTLRRKVAELEHAAGGEEEEMPDLDAQVDHIEDDVLRLIFLSCHPALTPESRAALTLRLVGGLTTAEIARGLPGHARPRWASASRGRRRRWPRRTPSSSCPRARSATERLDDVMAVIYLIFNEGYAATAGEDWMRPDLAHEAMRLARMLADLAPDEPEVLGLQALLELQGSRMARAARRATARRCCSRPRTATRWDQLLIRRGLAALQRAELLAARGHAGRDVLPPGLDRRPARPRRARRGHRLAPDRRRCTTSSPRPRPARSSR